MALRLIAEAALARDPLDPTVVAEHFRGSATVRLCDLGMDHWAREGIEMLARVGRVIVIARDRQELFAMLTSMASGRPGLSILLDRRRDAGPGPETERRTAGYVDAALAARGLAAVLDFPLATA